jgi:uncharacterized membrane protein SpoIIM required for sporulation
MILDLQRFLREEQPSWEKLEKILLRLERDPAARLSLAEVQEFHALYERAAADLAKVATFAAEPELRRQLETLVARAYAEIHETRERLPVRQARHWLAATAPQVFRRHVGAFWLAAALFFGGSLFGGIALMADPEAKAALVPTQFAHLKESPEQRVQREESEQKQGKAHIRGHEGTFAAQLIQNNIRVTLTAAGLGLTWGIGTIVFMFYNGLILGAVGMDYLLAGQTMFLFGWLLPHGVVEIPACLIGGQTGLVLTQALLGRRSSLPLRERLRLAVPDVATLLATAMLMLLWAGVVESFFSQLHEPMLPYAVKIIFGVVELILLTAYFGLAGRQAGTPEAGA